MASLSVAAVATSSAFGGGGGSPQIRGGAASCAALSPAQQLASARVVVDGTMLPGRTVLVGSQRVLTSPARMHVSRYLKGSGPRIVEVDTAVTPVHNGVAVGAEGIEPLPGQRWRIYSESLRQPLATSICSGSRRLESAKRALPLPPGAAWYSEALDTSAPTVANGLPRDRGPAHLLVQKWVTWQGNEYEKDSAPGLRLGPGGYSVGDSEPGFGDWDALRVHTLPTSVASVMRLLKSGRLEQGQTDPAERTSPLIWLAQVAAMLADDPNTPASRLATFKAIYSFPGLVRLGRVRDPQGRLGIAVGERASNLHPLLTATGRGCRSPFGGSGCVSVGKPSGSYELELIFDPSSHAVLAIRTVALSAIPAGWIKAGTVMREVTYLQGKIVLHPGIPPFPRPPQPTVESVPWHLLRVSRRRITVGWSSGTCASTLKPDPSIKAVETPSAVTLMVLVHVVKAGQGILCAGVGLGGTLSTTLASPLGHRSLVHGVVTDRDA